MNKTRPLHKFWFLLITFWVSELVYKIERRMGTAPDPAKLHKNIAGDLMVEWMQLLIREMPDTYQFMDDRAVVFKAFMYGCNPRRVAEALKKNRRVIPYCLHFSDGLA